MSDTLLLKKLFNKSPVLNIKQSILSAPIRHIFMNAVVWFLTKQKTQTTYQPLNILEIGSWMGASMLTWAHALDLYTQGEGSITCIDAWQPFFSLEEKKQDWYKEMDFLLESDLAYTIFCHNFNTLSDKLKKQHFRGQSENILPIIESSTFEVVYIDGDHSYNGAKSDISNSKRLVRDGGIICGDDLNLQLHDCDPEFVRKNAHRDFITEPTKNKNFHPGVTLAVYEEFGQVSSWAGFWAMQKVSNKWVRIDLTDMPVIFPSHLPEEAVLNAQSHLKDLIDLNQITVTHQYQQ